MIKVPKLKLVGEDGNAFAILARARKAARKAGWPQERIDEFLRIAKGGNYTHLLSTCMEYFEVK